MDNTLDNLLPNLVPNTFGLGGYTLGATGKLWVRAEDAVITSSPDIDSIPDLAGIQDVSQGTPGAKPHQVTDGGVVAAEFTTAGSKELVANSGARNAVNDLIGFVMAFRLRNTGVHGIFSLSATGAGGTAVVDVFFFSGNITWRAQPVTGATRSVSVAFSDTADYHVLRGLMIAGGAYARVDQGTESSAVGATDGAIRAGSYVKVGDNFAAYCDTNIAEMLLFAGASSAAVEADTAEAEAYLMGRYT